MTEDDLKALFALTDRIARETLALQEAQKVTDAQLAKTDAQLAALLEAKMATDAQFAETAAQVAKTSAKVDKLAEMYGGVCNNQGRVAEEFYYNSLRKHPVLNGIRFDDVLKNLHNSRGEIQDEFDIVMVNGSELYLIEVKYKAHSKDLDRLLHQKATNFRKLFPIYANYRQHLGLASFAFDDDLVEEALAQGVTVLQRRGDVIETTVPAM